MSIRLLWPFLELAPRDERPKLIEQLQTQFGLNAAMFNDPDTRVSFQRALDLLEEAIYRSGERRFGLHAAQRVTPEHLGVIEYLARSSGSLAEALQDLVHYARLLADGLHVCVETRGALTFVRVWFDSNLMVSPSVYEFAIATLLQCARRISGVPELLPVELHLMCSAPHDLTLYRALFQCNMCFNMPAAQIVLDSRTLNAPLPGAEPAFRRLLVKYANGIMAALPRNEDLVTMVRDLLTAETDYSHASATRLARRLGMGVRTLARRLGEAGTSYRALLDEARRQVALRDLAHTVRPIHHIAQQLGFSSSQSFHRAFRRWTGGTAASFRDRSRHNQTLQ